MDAVGRLARQARTAKGMTAKDAAERHGIAPKTLGAFETAATTGNGGRRLPNTITLDAIEAVCGWRPGAIRAAWDRRRSLTEVTMDMLSPEQPKGLLKASHLSDQELMAELNFRFLMRDNREQFDG